MKLPTIYICQFKGDILEPFIVYGDHQSIQEALADLCGGFLIGFTRRYDGFIEVMWSEMEVDGMDTPVHQVDCFPQTEFYGSEQLLAKN